MKLTLHFIAILSLITLSLSSQAAIKGWSGSVSYSSSNEDTIPSPNGHMIMTTEYDYSFKKSAESEDVIGYARTTQTIDSLSIKTRTVSCKINGVKVQKEETTTTKSLTTMEAVSESALALLEVNSGMYEMEKEVVLTVYALDGEMTIDTEVTVTGGCKEKAPKVTSEVFPYTSEKRSLFARGEVKELSNKLILSGSEDDFIYDFSYQQISCDILEMKAKTHQEILSVLRDSIIDKNYLMKEIRMNAQSELLLPPANAASFSSLIDNENNLWSATIGNAMSGITDVDQFNQYADTYKNSQQLKDLISLTLIGPLIPNGAPAVKEYMTRIDELKFKLSDYMGQYRIYAKIKSELEACYQNR